MEETKELYFKLFASCIPVKGFIRSMIYDLHRFNFELIPNSLYKILTKYKNYHLNPKVANKCTELFL